MWLAQECMTTGSMADKNDRRITAAETDRLLAAGHYQNLRGERVEITPILAEQSAGTILYEPNTVISIQNSSPRAMVVRVTSETAVEAISTFGDEQSEPCCLVFASARRPGGGYLSGANAQEESIARASTLIHSLHDKPAFYERHKASSDLAYSDSMIYAPHAALLRDGWDRLLDRPIRCAFITAAAPNATAMASSQRKDLGKIPAIIARRISRVLDVAAYHGHRRLILGAWGCGVFGLEANLVAASFASALHSRPWFDNVTFAIPHISSEQYQAFAVQFSLL